MVILCVSSPLQRSMTSDFDGFLSQMLAITFVILFKFLRKSQYILLSVKKELLVRLL